MFLRLAAIAILTATVQFSFADNRFPIKPDPAMTPGDLCHRPDTLRYPERIKYCSRDVSTNTKDRVIKTYDAKFGYNISHQNRQDFKIDHYIPLCMGGSNEIANLWPQHQTVYFQTDPLEGLMCEKMQAGRLKQAEAVLLIKRAKNDLSQVRAVLIYVQRL